jgi:hypothetical protein
VLRHLSVKVVAAPDLGTTVMATLQSGGSGGIALARARWGDGTIFRIQRAAGCGFGEDESTRQRVGKKLGAVRTVTAPLVMLELS